MKKPSQKTQPSAHARPISSGTTSPARVTTVCFTVLSQLPSMKNSRRILKSRRTGKPFSAKSDEAVKYAEDFILQVPPEYRDLRLGSPVAPISATVTVYYQSWRSDLDCALIYDCLQKAGVVANDRFIRVHHEYAEVDPENPRVELVLEEI